MDDEKIAAILLTWANRLEGALSTRIRYGDPSSRTDDGSIRGVSGEMRGIAFSLDPTKGQLDLTRETGPENSREEVTGQGGPGGKNRGYCNMGFVGGISERLAAAT